MSETKFTKGEWLGFKDGSWSTDDINEYDLDSNRYHSWVEITCNGEAVAIVPDCEGELDPNAHLIAAAPEMYAEIDKEIKFMEELKSLVISPYMTALLANRIEDKKNLLAKARGEA